MTATQIRRVLLLLSLASCALPAFSQPHRASSSTPRIDVESYVIQATLKPDSHEIKATAEITFKPLDSTDVVLFEKGEIASGESSHAAGLVTQFATSQTLMQFRKYSIELYSELGLFNHVGSLRVASTPDQLKELQAQRTEVANRLASRLNDVNRDLVVMARLETSQQQILREWIQLAEKTSDAKALPTAGVGLSKPAVVGSSVNATGHTQVSFRE